MTALMVGVNHTNVKPSEEGHEALMGVQFPPDVLVMPLFSRIALGRWGVDSCVPSLVALYGLFSRPTSRSSLLLRG